MEKIVQILKAERERWICWMPVLFGLGIGIYFALPTEPSYWLTLALIEILLLTVYLCRFYPSLLRLLTVLALILAGFADIQLKTLYLQKDLPRPQEGEVYIRGQIISRDVNYNGRQRIVLDDMENLQGDKIKGHYRLTTSRKTSFLEVGQCVEMVASVAPTMTANLVGGYQPDRRLFFDRINGSGYVLSSIYPIDCDRPLNSWSRLLNAWRTAINKRIKNYLPAEQAAVATAIVTGNRDLMTTEQVNNYRNSGLSHFLSISGLHMSMIAGLMFFAIRLLMACIPPLGLRYNSKKIAAICALIISSIYLLISGGAVSTQRAYIMTFLVLMAVWFERQAISMRVLAIAAMIILVISPQMLINISFQLSFAAVTALVAFYERCSYSLERFLSAEKSSLLVKFIKGVIAYLAGIVIADLVASAATLALVIYHFNRVAVYTCLANLLAGPIIGLVVMPAILIALLLLPFGIAGFPLCIAGWGIGIINAITAKVSEFSHAVIEIPSFPLWGLLLIIFGGLWLCLWQRRWRHLGWILIVIGGLSLLSVKTPDIIAGNGGKAIAVRNSQGKLQLLPGGNKWMKQNWLEKFASAQNQSHEDIAAPDLSNIDFAEVIGVSIYGDKTLTIRDYIGRRPWNN